MGISASTGLLSPQGTRQGKGRVQAGQGWMQGAHVSLSLPLRVTKEVVAEVGDVAASQSWKMICVQLKTHE